MNGIAEGLVYFTWAVQNTVNILCARGSVDQIFILSQGNDVKRILQLGEVFIQWASAFGLR